MSKKSKYYVDRIVKILALVILVELVLLLPVTAIKHTLEKKVKEHKSEKATVQIEEAETETETETEKVTETEAPKTKAQIRGIPEPPQVDLSSWEYILVNQQYTIDETFEPVVGYASSQTSSSPQDERIVDALDQLAAAAEAEGLPVYLSSGYRSYWDQNYLYQLQCQYYPPEEAAKIVALPGTSEHQTGLCCDITDYYREFKNDELEDTETYKWLYDHCAEYGFILRFPKGKGDITGIIYEPWHFRYVGKEAAEYIMKYDLTLEEFWDLYQDEQISLQTEQIQTEQSQAESEQVPPAVDEVPETEPEAVEEVQAIEGIGVGI